MANDGENLATILGARVEVIRGGNTDRLAAVLDDNVVWFGVEPADRCNNRREVLEVFARREGGAPRLTQLEVAEVGDTVVLTAAGPDFRDPKTGDPRPAVTMVFSLRDGRVVEMRGVRRPEEAIATADQ